MGCYCGGGFCHDGFVTSLTIGMIDVAHHRRLFRRSA
jgi:hypothetical protein